MSIIGYDGRLRPASRAAQANTPNGFDPNAVAKIGDAQPKFVEMATKLANEIGGDSFRYGEALAQKQKRLDALTDQENELTERQKAEDEARLISNSKNLTPEEKKRRADGISVSFAPTGNEERDRRLAVASKRISASVIRSIYDRANAEQARVDESDFAVFKKEGEYAIDDALVSAIPEILASSGSLDESAEKLDVFLNEQIARHKAKGGALMNKVNTKDYENWERLVKSRALSNLTGQFFKIKNEKGVSNVTVILEGAAEADNAQSTIDQAYGILTAPTTLELIPNDAKRMSLLTATAIEGSDLRTKRLFDVESARLDAEQKAALDKYQTTGDFKEYNAQIDRINAEMAKAYGQIEGMLVSDRDALLAHIDSRSDLGEEQRSAYKKTVEGKYRESIILFAKKKSAAIESKKKEWQAAKDASAKDALEQAKKFVSVGEVPSNGIALSLVNLIAESDAAEEINPDTDRAVRYARTKYPSDSDAVALEKVVRSFRAAITAIDLQGNPNTTVEAMTKILGGAVEVFGKNSAAYKTIASFAADNLNKEKNPHFSNLKSQIKADFYPDDDESEFYDKIGDEKSQEFRNMLVYLSEYRGPTGSSAELFEEYKRVRDDFMAVKKFDAWSPSEVIEGVTRNSMSTLVSTSAVKETPENKQSVRFDALKKEAERIGNKAELEALKSGDETNALGYSRAAKNAFWREKIVEDFGENELGRLKGFTNPRVVYEHLYNQKQNEIRLFGTEEQYEAALKRLKDAGLPTERSAYTSAFGIGGHPVNDSDEIELGVNPLFRDKLTLEEIEDILLQKKEIEEKGKDKDKRIKELEEKLKKQ